MAMRITLILKPTNRCNLRCKYCYHSEKGYENQCDLTSEQLEAVFKLFKQCDLSVLWHGGEPLLMGSDYLKTAIQIQEKVLGHPIKNRIQTNGTLIDQNFCDLIKDCSMSIGLSYDGANNEQIRGCTDQVLRAFELLNDNGIKYGVIHVLSDTNIRSLFKDYNYYKANRINVKFKIVFPVDGLIKAEQIEKNVFLNSLLDLYDEWFFDVDYKSSISNFEELIRTFFKNPKECIYASCLGKFLCVDPDMNIWICGRNFPNEYCLGNVSDFADVQQIFDTETFKNILSKSIEKRNECIKECSYYTYCHGGCINDSLLAGGIGSRNDFHCIFVKQFMERTKLNLKQDKPKNPFITEYLDHVRINYMPKSLIQIENDIVTKTVSDRYQSVDMEYEFMKSLSEVFPFIPKPISIDYDCKTIQYSEAKGHPYAPSDLTNHDLLNVILRNLRELGSFKPDDGELYIFNKNKIIHWSSHIYKSIEDHYSNASKASLLSGLRSIIATIIEDNTELIHGDFFPGNIIVGDEVSFIDLEYTTYLRAEYDIGRFIGWLVTRFDYYHIFKKPIDFIIPDVKHMDSVLECLLENVHKYNYDTSLILKFTAYTMIYIVEFSPVPFELEEKSQARALYYSNCAEILNGNMEVHIESSLQLVLNVFCRFNEPL